MTYRFKHIVEYAALRAGVAMVRRLPYPLALFLGWCIAWPAHYLIRFRTREARRRIRDVFADRYTDREVRRIAWTAWRNFIFTTVDLMRLPWTKLDWIKSHVIGWENARGMVEEQAAAGKGSVLATPHMGAWEIAAATLQRLGMPIIVPVAQQKNPLADAYINALRQAAGFVTLQRGSGLVRAILKQLHSGGNLAFLPDVRAKTEGIRIQFLGREANVPAGMAMFAYQANVPIVFGFITRVGWSRHHFHILPSIQPDRTREKAAEWRRMTQEVFSRIEASVREQPEQWFWYNKRWILDPLEPETPAPPSPR